MTLNTLKSILIISCVCSLICLFWIGYSKLQLLKEIQWQTTQLDEAQQKLLVKILLWSGETLTPFSSLGTGQNSFLWRKCPFTNCFVTANKKHFGDDITRFNVIAFMGRDLKPKHLPTKRAAHQKYIYFNMESSVNFPVKDNVFDGFFNWTSTYRLDSEIPIPYILIKDKNGNVIGPKKDMNWSAVLQDEENVTDFVFNNKTKAAAVFVSHCVTKSKRERVVDNLIKELHVYNLSVDIYGHCGPFKCPRDKKDECDRMLGTDYYFYLSFENSFDEDYVTEKLLTAVQNNVVPIVYGGADYTRFLPPGSYLDARKLSRSALAEVIVHLMKTPEEYKQYFKWKKYYTYHDPLYMENICNVCTALNDRSLLNTSRVYDHFRSWWNPVSSSGASTRLLMIVRSLLLHYTVLLWSPGCASRLFLL